MPPAHPSFGDQIPANSAVIALHLRDLNQFFNSMDPSPFHEKELNDEAEEYIVEGVKELSGKTPATIVVYLSAPVGLPDEARVLGEAIRAHFARRAQVHRRQQRELLRRGLINLIIGSVLLVASVIVGDAVTRRTGHGPFATVLSQSLVIGGWVAMSRPVEILLYDWWLIRRDRKIHERLGQIPVRIVYTGTAASGVRAAAGSPEHASGSRSV